MHPGLKCRFLEEINPLGPVRCGPGQNRPWGNSYEEKSLKLFTNFVYSWSWEGDGVIQSNKHLNLFLMLVYIQTITLQRKEERIARQFSGKKLKAYVYYISTNEQGLGY